MAHVGTMKCPAPGCKGEAAVSHATSGTRNVRCAYCGFSGYGPTGSKAARLIDQATTPADDDQPAPAAKTAPAPAARKPAPAAFGLGQL